MKCSFALLLLLITSITNAQKISFILDADTGNEMDDLYAIVRAVQSSRVEVIALTSTHFNNAQMLTDSLWHIYPTRGIESTKISQQLNEELLTALGRTDIPHLLGARQMLGYSWGYYPGAPVPQAPAIDFMIEKARAASPTRKLNIVCLGPVTNVAAAVTTAPDIAPNIRVYMLGMRYNFQTVAWNKNEFNARNDLNGLDELLNNAAIEMIIMPANIAESMRFTRQESMRLLAVSTSPAAPILARRWDEVDAQNDWIMWDLALMEAVINPSVVGTGKWLTPPENTRRFVQVYNNLNAPVLRQQFWYSMRPE